MLQGTRDTHIVRGISLGVLGRILEKIMGNDLPDDVTPVLVTIQFQRYKLREAQADGAVALRTIRFRLTMVKTRVCKMMSQIHIRIQVSLISCEHHGLPI